MIQVERFLRAAHAVSDRSAVQRFYQDVFGAKLFHQGLLKAEGRQGCLLLISNLCIEPVSPAEDARVEPFLAHRGPGLYSLLLKVKELRQAEEHLASSGIRVERRGPSCIAAYPEDCFGILLEFTERDLPGDPRLRAGWSPAYWTDEHPAGIDGVWAVTTLVTNLDRAQEFYAEALGAKLLFREEGRTSRERAFMAVGSGILGLLEPRTMPSDLTRLVQQQGAEGFHAVALRVKDRPGAVRYFRSKGIGVVGGAEEYVMPHPRMCFGARSIIVPVPEPGEPRREFHHRFQRP